MVYTTLHKIVTGILLKKRYPIHFYIEYLTYCASGLRELHFDSMQEVRTKLLTINSYGAITCPCDMMDWIKIGVPNGQYVRPLATRPGMNRLNNFDTTGAIIPYDDTDFFTGYVPFGSIYSPNDLGRYYGSRGNGDNSFILVKERNEIQINVSIDATSVILEYLSDGTDADNATKVNPYAISALEAYADWQEEENKRGASDYSKRMAQNKFDYQHSKLRGRINGLTAADVKYIWNRNTHGSLK